MSLEKSSKPDTVASEIKAKKKSEKKKDKPKSKKISNDEEDEINAVNEVEEEAEKKSKPKKSKKRQRDDQDDENEDKNDMKKNKEKKKSRKSVSFSENVETHDSEKNEASNQNTEKVTETEEKDVGDDGDEEDNNDDDEHKRKKRKQEKREKREQRRKKDTPTTDSSTSHGNDKSILAYLSQYHHDRASWKFQKIRETQLLKHGFSLEQVPAEYNPALLAYLKGLQSEGARTRLRKSAQDIIKADVRMTTAETQDNGPAGGDDEEGAAEEAKDISKLPVLPESWRERYADAIYRFKGNLNAGVKDFNDGVSLDASVKEDETVDADILTRFENRKRAEMVLWTVSGKINKSSSAASKPQEAETEASKPTAKGNKHQTPAKKKRKNRTMVVEISSSSESDSD